jgi:hypothetical protein
MSRQDRREERQYRGTADYDAIAAVLTAKDLVLLEEFAGSVGAEWRADPLARARACDLAFCHTRDRLIAAGMLKRDAETKAVTDLRLPPTMATMLRRLRTVQFESPDTSVPYDHNPNEDLRP